MQLKCGSAYSYNNDVAYTNDVTHAMALILKYELNADDKYQSFIQRGCRS